ncbi:MAG: N(4)-(beta-N-acetylglucosaminyl)-L-asparaginase [Clostridia bacterium]|nr:N(4)-(beta-N-acetylglucosaminyl)-L-asparaginase [Clostridia bacterium]
MWSFVSTWYFSKQAAQAGKTVLESGGDAMDAVIKGINRVESDPEVESVGKGGFLNENGELALDAAVMDGNTMKTGAVCAVRGFENPINIARAVMENTKHNILIGAGAESFARNMGIKESDMESLITDHARDVLKKAEERGHDTIGAIALDSFGKMAVGTSTSGANMKLMGRVGDSPLIGSGFYVESGVGGAAATGLGEDIMRTCCSFRCVVFMRMGLTPKEAVEKTVILAHETIIMHGGKPDCIALICMNAKGEYAAAANHKGFTYAFADENTPPQVAEVTPIIDKDEDGPLFDGVAGYER